MVGVFVGSLCLLFSLIILTSLSSNSSSSKFKLLVTLLSVRLSLALSTLN